MGSVSSQHPDYSPGSDTTEAPEGAASEPVRAPRRRRAVRPADVDARARAAAEALEGEPPEHERHDADPGEYSAGGDPPLEPEYQPRPVEEAIEDVTSGARLVLLAQALKRARKRKKRPDMARLEKTARRMGEAFGKRVGRWEWLDKLALGMGMAADLFAPKLEDALEDALEADAPGSQVVDAKFSIVEAQR